MLTGVQFLKQAGLFSLSLHLDHFLGYSDLHLVLMLRMCSILLHHFVLVPLLIHIAVMCSMLETCVVGCTGHIGIEPPEQNCKCSTPWILNIMTAHLILSAHEHTGRVVLLLWHLKRIFMTVTPNCA